MQTLPSMIKPITLDMNQDFTNATITKEDKDPYQFGNLNKGFRVKSAVLSRRGIKTSSSTRSIHKTRNILGT